MSFVIKFLRELLNYRLQVKVQKYTWSIIVAVPSSERGPPTPSPSTASECAPPHPLGTKGGEDILACVRGLEGGSQFGTSDDWRKSLTLCLHFGYK
jgi:hypothetical protein